MKRFNLLLLLLFIPMLSLAGVNLKNGNFYLSFTDIRVPGNGHDLVISRVYNSKSTYKGWFGFGWGSDFETYLQVGAGGSVIIHENGSGAQTRFVPKTKIDAASAANKIVNVMREKSKLQGSEANLLIKKLTNDAELRQAYSKRFGIKADLATGTILYSSSRGLQKIHVTKEGYKRVYNDGKVEKYNKLGKLTSVSDKHGYKINFDYGKDSHLKSIKDSFAKQVNFAWYPSGYVKHIWSVDKRKVLYKYENKNLAESKDVAANVYKYEYDANHNLTAIRYQDNTSLTLKYHRFIQFVTEVKSRNGEVTKYEYKSNDKNPDNHYWTLVTKKSLSGKMVTNRYEYETKVRNDGSKYTYRILTVVNGIKTETIYNKGNSLPLKITRGKHKTTFKYNKKGLLIDKRSSNGEFVKLDYHKKLNKITKVENNEGWTKFSYKAGNLYKAENNSGKSVLLIYDRKGRITKMVDYQQKGKKKTKRTLSFKYNAQGKPIEIQMDKVGKINVAYDNYGEIKKVESKAGHRMALQVTQAFQSLLAIVKPAGVNLNL